MILLNNKSSWVNLSWINSLCYSHCYY
jgi:hypothetical protein